MAHQQLRRMTSIVKNTNFQRSLGIRKPEVDPTQNDYFMLTIKNKGFAYVSCVIAARLFLTFLRWVKQGLKPEQLRSVSVFSIDELRERVEKHMFSYVESRSS